MFERRVHYKRQNHYATKSNKYRIVKTPGKNFPFAPWAASPSIPFCEH